MGRQIRGKVVIKPHLRKIVNREIEVEETRDQMLWGKVKHGLDLGLTNKIRIKQQ